jgi:hypothetical protein
MFMKYTVELQGRRLDIEVSRAASEQLDKLKTSLKIEMELYFSCMIRKQVRFRETLDTLYKVAVNEKLEVGFRPVMTKKCSITDTDENGKPPLTDFPIVKPESYIPHWLKLDFRKGEWRGEFGYLDPT